MSSSDETAVLVTPPGTLEADCLTSLLQSAKGFHVQQELASDTSAVLLAAPRGVPGPSEELVDRVRTRGLPVVVMVHLIEPWTIALTRSVRGCGVVSWRSPGSVVVAAIRASLAGRPVNRGPFGHGDPVLRLSEREREVMAMVALGEHNDEIGRRLEISTHTVESHVQHALMKLGVTHRHAAATVVRHSDLMAGHLRNFRSLAALAGKESA